MVHIQSYSDFSTSNIMTKIVFTITTLMIVFLNQVYGIRKESLNKLEYTESIHSRDNTLVIIGSAKSYIKIYEGEDLTINCDVDGNAKASKTWYKDITRLDFEDNVCITDPRLTLDTWNNLVINDATTDDNGNYVCGIRDVKGISTKSAFLTVLTENFKELLNGPETIKPIPLKNKPEYTYISTTWLIAILISFVAIMLILFVIVKIHQRKRKHVSMYSLQISPIERVNEIQQNEFKNKNGHVENWIAVDVDDDRDTFLSSIENNSGHNKIIKPGINDKLLLGERHDLQFTSTNLFDCKCVHPDVQQSTTRPNSPCF